MVKLLLTLTILNAGRQHYILIKFETVVGVERIHEYNTEEYLLKSSESFINKLRSCRNFRFQYEIANFIHDEIHSRFLIYTFAF